MKTPSCYSSLLLAGGGAWAQEPATLARRKELGRAPHRFAVIVNCAAPRVSPGLLFRTAGTLVDDAIAGSIEYAVEHLGAKLVMVLDHRKCVSSVAAPEPASVVSMNWSPTRPGAF